MKAKITVIPENPRHPYRYKVDSDLDNGRGWGVDYYETREEAEARKVQVEAWPEWVPGEPKP